MPREIFLLLESFAAFFAFERSFPSVCSLVPLQVTRSFGGVVALVTLEWLLSTMCPRVLFHVARRNASITALVTPVQLFFSMLKPRVLL